MAAHLDPTSQPLGDASDMELVEYTRAGNSAAFGELWVRHSNAGRAVARSHRFDADDLLSEAFARVFQAISAGGGPTAAFRPYLFTTIRNVSMQWARAKSADASEDLDLIADPSTEEDASLAALDKSLTVNAFRSLPTRWQEALWYSEVEQLSSAEIAPLLGMKANAVSALTYRAREGLRQAWIQAHLKRTTDPECAATIERLGSFTRGMLGTRESKKVRDHLAGCTSCTIVADEARQVGSRLALVLLPLAAGVSGAAGYLAWLQAGSGSAAGLVAAAMPGHVSASVTQTAAPAHLASSTTTSLAGVNKAAAATSASTTAAPHAAGGTSGSAGAGGGAGVSGAGASGAGPTGIGAIGIGAGGIVGTAIGVIALAAAVVAAVTLGPSLFSPTADNTTISADKSDDSAADDTGGSDTDILPAPTPAPVQTPTETPAPTPTPEPTQPSSPTKRAVAPDPVSTDSPPPGTAPEQPTTPTAVEPTTPPVEPTTPPVVPTEPPIEPETPAVPNSQYVATVGNRTYPTFSGTAAESGSTIDLIDDAGESVAHTTADEAGNWTIGAQEFGTSLAAGTQTLRVTQTVDDKVSDPAFPQSVTMAAPEISSPTANQVFENGLWTLTLTGDDGASVDVDIDHDADGGVDNTLHVTLFDGVSSMTYGNLAEVYRLNIRYVDEAGGFGVTQSVRFTVTS